MPHSPLIIDMGETRQAEPGRTLPGEGILPGRQSGERHSSLGEHVRRDAVASAQAASPVVDQRDLEF
jgi:hypothetical protein